MIANNVMYNATGHSIQVDNRGTQHTNDQNLISKLHVGHFLSYKSRIDFFFIDFKYRLCLPSVQWGMVGTRTIGWKARGRNQNLKFLCFVFGLFNRSSIVVSGIDVCILYYEIAAETGTYYKGMH